MAKQDKAIKVYFLPGDLSSFRIFNPAAHDRRVPQQRKTLAPMVIGARGER
jgi:hypothetical protein